MTTGQLPGHSWKDSISFNFFPHSHATNSGTVKSSNSILYHINLKALIYMINWTQGSITVEDTSSFSEVNAFRSNWRRPGWILSWRWWSSWQSSFLSCSHVDNISLKSRLLVIYINKVLPALGKKVITPQSLHSKFKCHTNLLHLHEWYLWDILHPVT